jgi:hypothetical protein
MRINNEELLQELKLRLNSEKSIKNKVVIKKIIELVNSLN